MFVVDYNNKDESAYMLTAYVGDGRIADVVVDRFGENANILIQADGDELENIARDFKNIPMTNARVVRWTGEMAWFIVNNIKL